MRAAYRRVVASIAARYDAIRADVVERYDAFQDRRTERFLAGVLRGLRVRRDWPVNHWIHTSKGWD